MVDLQVHRTRGARGETGDRSRRRVEPPDPVGAVVREEVVARIVGGELRQHGVVEGAARDRAGRAAVGVGGDGVGVGRVRRIAGPLADRPPVVGACRPVVDLLPRHLPDVVDEDPAASRLHAERERVAQAERPDRPVVAARGREGVVGRDQRVRRHTQPQQLSEQVRQNLRVPRVRVVPDCDVKLSVRSEVQRAPVVVARSGKIVQVQEDHLAARHRHVAVGREAAQPVVNRRGGCRVIDVNVLVLREVGVEGDSEQPPLSARIHGHRQKRGRQQDAVLDHPKLAALLAHEHAPVRRQRHRCGAREARRERLGETGRQRRAPRQGGDGQEQGCGEDPSSHECPLYREECRLNPAARAVKRRHGFVHA